MAKESDAHLVLLHVLYVPISIDGLSASNIEAMAIFRDRAKAALHALENEAVAAGVRRVSSDVVSGVGTSTILDVLAGGSFDLCVMGTNGRSGPARLLLGSSAEVVLRRSEVPVMTVRPEVALHDLGHVLVPTDFSESSDRALELARSLVAPGGAVTILHVVEPPIGKLAGLDKSFEADTTRELVRRTNDPANRCEVRTTTRRGTAELEIIRMLEEDASFGLVVMGSRGRSALARLLFDSVAENTVRHARCPVLTVRDARRRA